LDRVRPVGSPHFPTVQPLQYASKRRRARLGDIEKASKVVFRLWAIPSVVCARSCKPGSKRRSIHPRSHYTRTRGCAGGAASDALFETCGHPLLGPQTPPQPLQGSGLEEWGRERGGGGGGGGGWVVVVSVDLVGTSSAGEMKLSNTQKKNNESREKNIFFLVLAYHP